MASRRGNIPSEDACIEREIREAIGSRISELRRKRKLSARLVGEKLGVSREAITHIETGRNNITAIALWKLATLFRCDIKDFFPTSRTGTASPRSTPTRSPKKAAAAPRTGRANYSARSD